jgi:hypothetical protein
MVGQGLLHCMDDFCPDCAHNGACDLTCGFCPESPPADGGNGNGKGRRRNQISVDGGTACAPADFEQRTDDVNDACCDDGVDTKCSGGVPTSCDARCALTYNPYFGECKHLVSETHKQPAVACGLSCIFVLTYIIIACGVYYTHGRHSGGWFVLSLTCCLCQQITAVMDPAQLVAFQRLADACTCERPFHSRRTLVFLSLEG